MFKCVLQAYTYIAISDGDVVFQLFKMIVRYVKVILQREGVKDVDPEEEGQR